MTIAFSRFSSGQRLPEQRELFDDAFPEHRGKPTASSEHYRWKFHTSPFVPQSYEFAADEDGKMLGYYAAIPYQYEIEGRRMMVGMVCDVMTHSRARGSGVFTKLGSYALEELEITELAFVTGYPVRPEVMGGHLRVGWKVAFELPMYLRPLRANAIAKSRGVPWLAPVLNAGVAAHQATLAPRGVSADYDRTVGPPAELLHTAPFQRFVGRWAQGVENHLIKSPEFYDWRLGAPGVDYRAFVISRGETVLASAVGRQALLHGVPSFALLEMMALGGEEGALRALHFEIEQEARRLRAEAVVTMMSRVRAREYRLFRFGFLRSPFVFKLIIRSLKDDFDIEQVSREAGWHLMWIDSDDL
ncbi:MAG TPA: GNAT family N-acetyltransferase [Solirubrobacteraceae bacterium]|nr:GNAT family N-acetyltransferase [Solirubrobacteraceae bacterium]